MQLCRRAAGVVVGVLVVAGLITAQQPDLSDFKAVENCITAKVVKARSTLTAQPGFLGINVVADRKGNLMIDQVAEESPASAALTASSSCTPDSSIFDWHLNSPMR